MDISNQLKFLNCDEVLIYIADLLSLKLLNFASIKVIYKIIIMKGGKFEL